MGLSERSYSKGYPAPPLPEDFSCRLGRLEDLSGDPLEEFARHWRLPEDRADEWRCGALPTAHELRAMVEWACSVRGGVAVLMRPCSEPWPYGDVG